MHEVHQLLCPHRFYNRERETERARDEGESNTAEMVEDNSILA
jgi:hypothetical protein